MYVADLCGPGLILWLWVDIEVNSASNELHQACCNYWQITYSTQLKNAFPHLVHHTRRTEPNTPGKSQERMMTSFFIAIKSDIMRSW